MNIRDIKTSAKLRLEGKMPEAWGAIGSLAGTWLLFRLVSAVGGFAAVSLKDFAFNDLLLTSNLAWLFFKIACRVLSFIFCSLALLSTSIWYCRQNDETFFRRILNAPCGKWIGICVISSIIRFVPLLAGGMCFYGAYNVLNLSLDVYTGNGEYLMLSVCLFVLGICMLFYRLYITLLFILCPFIIAAFPNMSIFSIMRMSAMAMRGGVGRIVKFIVLSLSSPINSLPIFFMMLSVYAQSCNVCNQNVTE